MAQEHGAEGMCLGSLGTRQGDLDQLIRKMPSKAKHLICIYAAGPCGYGLYRSLRKKGDDCWGVAPSLLPQKPGDRVNTDRRDAMQLARLARSGALTVVSVPKGEDEAIRDLSRAPEDAIRDLQDATVRLQAFWLRPARRSTGRAHGSPAPLPWLSEVVWPTAAQHIVVQESLRAGNEHHERLQRLQQELHEQVKTWRLCPGVEALQARRGGQCTGAVPLVAAMGALTRCESPRELMQLLGLMPAAHSSGEKRHQGAITKAGNPHARRVLVEGAWAYRSLAKVSRPLHRRLETPPKVIQAISGKAQVRLCKRSRRLGARGNQATVVTVAIARELSGFMGAMAKEGPIAVEDPNDS